MKKKFSFYPSTPAEDAALCLCTFAFTAAFYGDNYLSGEIMEPVRIVSFAAMALCWLWESIFNGLRMRRFFPVLAVLCFALLPLGEFACEKTDFLKFSDLGLLVREAYKYYTALVFSGLEKAAGISSSVCSFCMLGLCLTLYGAGYGYTKKNILTLE